MNRWKTTKCLLRVTSSWIPFRRNYSRRAKELLAEVSQVGGVQIRLTDLLELLELVVVVVVAVLPWLSSRPWPW